MTTVVKCPTCVKDVVWGPESEFRPFCCKRCQLIDLGEWANEEKSIPESPLASAMSEADLDRIENMLAQQENEFFK
ncbi:DNA gyrase inhibitor YacG [Psychrosphaera sp. B3R10]|uniref:DNA gyrase inhibitor YacG n=1 Tax=Psychrosphaera algicola TaxID=3023714 RepID=A0ABT5FCU8_9GAMM|nr:MULTISPECIES: DNA gyrase inhibitor YacG [unclassified Psychrosphaera]MBU2882505.1 DNA gyrase inhibitor YacG [Psychrosphaera sp. I2R16]MBU2989477.1 DNA gyrase inhibitor YacG [Psychrosphaera sp. B3R10]MDC2889375.1 DNA gyrase inhibitor YacG [Psychrosphaera sp. G1-22]MDO6718311.1 DNA gyrase inhibitor YacG [Psychrosphaera sp. 1_MG-2023]